MHTYSMNRQDISYNTLAARLIKRSKISICGSKRRADIWINLMTRERT